MSAVAIYVEGGGDSKESRAALRVGLDGFLSKLKEQARAHGWRWKLVTCGSREQAKDAFLNALAREPGTRALLLVDAERAVSADPSIHLAERDGWRLPAESAADVHLMVQLMETWLVADLPALQRFYGERFNANALPRAANLESVDKRDIARALERATQGTQKGTYHKIRHAQHLLQRVDPEVVRSRCPHCGRLLDRLAGLLAGS